MQEFVLSGRAVDFVLLVIVLEFIALVARRRDRSLRDVADLFFMLAPGALLLLAVKAALNDAGWVWVALLIAASFPLHLIDLLRRGRGRPGIEKAAEA
jgi:hypothetical protein